MAKRRGSGEGSIYQRKDGRWAASITFEGRRVSRYAKTRAQAAQKLRDLQRLEDRGLSLANSRMRLREYLEQWLTGARNRLRPGVFDAYEVMVRVHIVPNLGHVALGKLGPEHIERAWDDMLRSGKSRSVIDSAHRRLSKALNDAVRRHLIHRNPCHAVTPPRPTRRELHPPDAEAIRRILEVADRTDYYEVLHTAFYTGLRRGELLALEWRDVNLDMAVVSVNRSVHRARGGYSIFQEPKTAHGRRLVSLTPSSVSLLRATRARQETDALLFGYHVKETSPVFRYRNGSPILPRGLTAAFSKISRRAGYEGYRLHDARHAHATLMLSQGVHPKIVQERLGHSRIGVTLDTYSHVTPGLQEAAALRFEESLAPRRLQWGTHRRTRGSRGRLNGPRCCQSCCHSGPATS